MDPIYSEVDWIEDEEFDLQQETARASYADMLHDHERNEKYYRGLEKAITRMKASGRPANVLDIGTGTGLLSMMAARLGADSVVACEAFVPIAKCAKEIIKENGFADRIQVVEKLSTQMTVGPDGDLKQKPNILVTEVFDSDFIGEGAILTFKHALEVLLEEDPIVVPSSGRVYIEVIESDLVRKWSKLEDFQIDCDTRLKVPINLKNCPGTYSVHDLQLSQFPTEKFKTIVEPLVVFSFDFLGKQILEFNRKSVLDCIAKIDGTANAVFMYWDITMDLDGEIVLSVAPHWAHPDGENGANSIPWRDHWMQEIYHFPKNVEVAKGDRLKLISNHDKFGFWFNLFSAQDYEILGGDAISFDRPACTCNLHNTCSYSRIGMLNDEHRRYKYLTVLKRFMKKYNEEGVVTLSFGDCSLLPLLALLLGAKKVYCYESSALSKRVITDFADYNGLSEKIQFISSKLDKDSESSINISANEFNTIIPDNIDLFISEPFFNESLYPWHNLKWKLPSALSNDCMVFPGAAVIWAMAVNFDNLHKIKAPLNSVFNFSVQHFDKLINKSSVISDRPIDLQPLWEYPTTALSHPFKLFDFDLNSKKPDSDLFVQKTVKLEGNGRLDGIVIWVEHKLDDEISISCGPKEIESIVPGKKVPCWDMYTKQAVWFLDPFRPCTVQPNDELNVFALFSFSQQSDLILKVDLTSKGTEEVYKNLSGTSSNKFKFMNCE